MSASTWTELGEIADRLSNLSPSWGNLLLPPATSKRPAISLDWPKRQRQTACASLISFAELQASLLELDDTRAGNALSANRASPPPGGSFPGRSALLPQANRLRQFGTASGIVRRGHRVI